MSESSSRPLAPVPGRPLKQRKLSSDDGASARKNKTTACKACKQKKWKCLGDPPCQHCVANGIECEVDEMSDMRRKFAMKRNLDRLEQAENTLEHLVSALRDSESKRKAQLLNLIRSDASFEEIRMFLEQQFSRSKIESTPELREVQRQVAHEPENKNNEDPSPSNVGRRVLAVQRLTDIPICRVPAKPWTTVTDDDDLVSHLVSLWLTWTYSSFNLLDKETFLRDMQACNLKCQFCSPFLVNAILAEATFYSDYAEVFTVPNDMFLRGNHFYDEARRLLEEEDDDECSQASLPTIQGLAILCIRASLMGKDRIGWVYLDLAVRGAKEYAASHPPRPTYNESARVVENAINRTLWGIFSIATLHAVSLMKHLDVHPPRRPRIPIDHENHHDVWSPYPRHVDAVPGHVDCVFDRWCDICCITIKISRAFYDAEEWVPRSETLSIVNDVYRQLQAWYANLPDCLRVETVALPHVLSLHMIYHTTVMQIFGLLKANDAALDQSIVEHARTTCLSSARHNAQLIRIHRSKWGIDRMSPATIQWLSVGMFTLLESLDSTENCNAFIELCIVAGAISRRENLARGILRMIQLSASQMQVSLPEEIDALFMEFETQSWEERDRYGFSSFYPHFATAVRQGETREADVAMDRFLQKWDTLNLARRE